MKDKSVEQIQEDSELLNALIEKYIIPERQEKFFQLFSGDTGANFLTAPASSKEEYHNSYCGGLFDHTLNVFSNLVKLNEAMELGFSEEVMFTVCLLHDFGKACAPDLVSPFYIPAQEWKQKKLGQRFEYNSDQYMTTRDRTLFVLQSFGIKLSFEVYQAIMLNDGLIMEGNRSYSMKECPLAFWLQVADSWAARKEQEDAQKQVETAKKS